MVPIAVKPSARYASADGTSQAFGQHERNALMVEIVKTHGSPPAARCALPISKRFSRPGNVRSSLCRGSPTDNGGDMPRGIAFSHFATGRRLHREGSLHTCGAMREGPTGRQAAV